MRLQARRLADFQAKAIGSKHLNSGLSRSAALRLTTRARLGQSSRLCRQRPPPRAVSCDLRLSRIWYTGVQSFPWRCFPVLHA